LLLLHQVRANHEVFILMNLSRLRQGSEPNLDIIKTGSPPAPVGPYSQAVRAGDFLFVSGQGPLDPTTRKTVAGGIESQTKQVIENLKAILTAANLVLGNVVKVSVFLKDMDDFKNMNQVYGSYFNVNPPARTTVQAQLPMPDWLIEIDVVACSV
jgi:2-iminobutanoate/2-iminopropanoate deaminase